MFSIFLPQVGSSDIALRPQPIKRVPYLDSSHAVSSSEAVNVKSLTTAARGKEFSDFMTLPRPSSTGSSFQPIRTVFKTKLKDQSSSGGRNIPSGNQSEDKLEFRKVSYSTSSVSGSVAAASVPVSLAMVSHTVALQQQPPMKMGQMTIHNITMTQDRQQLIVSSDTQTPLGRGTINGSVQGKMTKGALGRGNVRVTSHQPPQQITISANSFVNKPATSSVVQIIAAPQLVATCAGQVSGTVTPTFATIARPIATPIPIASKPVNTTIQTGVMIPASQKGGRAASMSAVGMQPAAILPNSHATSVQKVGTIVLQGSQYSGMTLLNTSNLSATAGQSPKLQAGNASVHTAVNSQAFMTTLRNIAPPQNSTPHTQSVQAAQPTQLVTNLVLKANPAGSHSTQAPTQTLNINPSQQPTHVRYILPSVQVSFKTHEMYF